MRAKTDDLDEKLTNLYRKARPDLNTFRAKIQLSEAEKTEKLEPAFFHKQWSDELLNGAQSIACEGFRECGKSSILKAFLLYCLTFPSHNLSYIALMRGNKTSASKVIKEISRDYQENPLMYGASLKSIIEDSAEAFCIETHSGIIIRIEAYGKGSAIRGASYNNRRPDVVILDDIQDKEDMRSEMIPENDWDWFLSDIKFLGKQTRFFFIGNNLGDKCIIERLISTADSQGQGLFGFKCYKIPSIIDGKATWEERFSIEYLEKERQEMQTQGKLDLWLMERMCLSLSDETRVFKKEDFRYFDLHLLDTSDMSLYCALDPASSINPDSCYRALTTIAVDSKNRWYILNIRYGRWDSVEMLNCIFDTVKTYKLADVGIEKGHYQQVIEPFLHKEMQRRNIFFNVLPLEHGKRGSKLERIKMLSPRFASHSVFMAKGQEWLPELETELLGVTRSEIKSQYIDLVDSLAMLEQIADAPVDNRNDIDNDLYGREVYADTSSWRL